MAVEEVYMNSTVTRKTAAEFEKGFNPELQWNEDLKSRSLENLKPWAYRSIIQQ